MSAKYKIASVNFSVPASSNQTLTISHKLASSSVWVKDTQTAVALPNGDLYTPYEIMGLAEGVAYDIKVSNNCNGEEKVQTVTMPVSSGTNNFTIQNDAVGAVMTQFYIDGTGVLTAPITHSYNTVYDFGSIGAGPHVLKMDASGVTGQVIEVAHVRGASVVQSEYLTPGGSSMITLLSGVNFLNGDLVVVRLATQHKAIGEYSSNNTGSIEGVCSLNGYTLTRSAQARADAIETGEGVNVTVRLDADNGSFITQVIHFDPTDLAKSGIDSGTIGTGSCSLVTVTITSIA